MVSDKNTTVLVVEDHLDTQLLMKHILKNEGYTVILSGTASSAFEYLETQKLPDVILLDLTLPEMSGEEFMAKLRSHPDWKNLKVLIISGWDNLKEKAEAVGADGYLRKPFQIAQFYRQLEATVTSRGNEITISP